MRAVFCRKCHGEAYVLSVLVLGFLLYLSSAEYYNGDIEDIDGREKFLASLREESSKQFRTRLRPLLRVRETESETHHDSIETPETDGRMGSEFPNVGTEKLSFRDVLYDDEEENEWELFEEGDILLRNLQNESNETDVNIEMEIETPSSNVTVSTDGMVIDISIAVIAVTIALGITAMLISILALVFVYLYRKNNIVRIGQPPFLYLICFGSILMSSELFFGFRHTDYTEDFKVEDKSLNDATCVVELWFKNIGIVCVNMAIFSKLWRANKVAQFRRNQTILPRHVIGPFVGMIVAVIALTTTQTILDPPVWQAVKFVVLNPNGSNRDNTSINIGSCVSKFSIHPDQDKKRRYVHDEKYLWIDVSLDALIFLSLVVMLYMAWATRNIPEDISDSKRVFQIVIAVLCSMAVMHGLEWLGFWLQSYGLSVLSKSLRYFFEAIIYVGFLVVPKIHRVWREKRSTNQKNADETKGRAPNVTTSSVTTDTINRGKGKVYVRGLNPANGDVVNEDPQGNNASG